MFEMDFQGGKLHQVIINNQTKSYFSLRADFVGEREFREFRQLRQFTLIKIN